MTSTPSQTVLLIAPVVESLSEKLAAHFEVHRLYEQAEPLAWLGKHGSSVRAVVTRGDVGVSNAVLELLPALGLIAIFGVGTDGVDLNFTRQHNIAVTITSGVLTSDVADMALGLILSGARNLVAGDKFVREGQWLNHSPTLGNRVSGKRIGIVGMGNIGRAIAKRAVAFDMAVSYVSRSAKPDLPYVCRDDLISLAQDSDFLVIAASGGDDTRRLIDAAVLSAMPQHAWLINIARGSLVDEQALIAALQSNAIAGAAMDVYEAEPHVPAELIALENVVLQPHVGSATHETRQKMRDVVFANVDAFFKQQTLPNAI
ncbi:MAG: 2-hydroxyacid dehydrogenase [Enterobacterales bacterium endosymbiont of Blomia tropicalis]|uniref:2-hydroxyacid dehydrogenase n=1 Tax=Mixta mediterraneensis TaxID=2758443 RepID=UPI0025A704BD|nr:2-hydroxyacid dehydrogenase [Mixta mediterraneensis]MDL4914519.1 2-hydroxyacid dehydrogenase [Mixta mediterraneensis]